MDQVLDTGKSVTLNASGSGSVTLQPEGFRTWKITTINVRTSQGPTTTPVPQCTVYLGAVGAENIIAQTWMGNRSTATGTVTVQPSQQLIVEWANGVPGSVATVSIYGTQSMR